MPEFNKLGQQIFGYGWQSKLAIVFKVNRRTVGRWATGEYDVPENILVALRIMAQS